MLEVRQIFAALIPKVWRCRKTFKTQELGNALYGLQGTTDGSEEIGNEFALPCSG